MNRSPSPGGDELPVIHRYTRREALVDGVLIDVTRQASPAEMHGGFVVPVAVTAALWHAIEAIPPNLHGIADARGRLHDVLWMASCAVRRLPSNETPPLVTFAVVLPVAGNRKRMRWLTVASWPDEDGTLCVTIGFPEDF